MQPKDIPEEGAIGGCVSAVDDHVGTKHHETSNASDCPLHDPDADEPMPRSPIVTSGEVGRGFEACRSSDL
jgi:hypothetical protein